MSDEELQKLARTAKDDPGLRSIYLNKCYQVGRLPGSSEELEWEHDFLSDQKKLLSSRNKSFILRLLENFLHDHPKIIGLLINFNERYKYDYSWNIKVATKENDEKSWDFERDDEEDYGENLRESFPQVWDKIVEYSETFTEFFGDVLTLKIKIINGEFKLFIFYEEWRQVTSFLAQEKYDYTEVSFVEEVE